MFQSGRESDAEQTLRAGVRWHLLQTSDVGLLDGNDLDSEGCSVDAIDAPSSRAKQSALAASQSNAFPARASDQDHSLSLFSSISGGAIDAKAGTSLPRWLALPSLDEEPDCVAANDDSENNSNFGNNDNSGGETADALRYHRAIMNSARRGSVPEVFFRAKEAFLSLAAQRSREDVVASKRASAGASARPFVGRRRFSVVEHIVLDDMSATDADDGTVAACSSSLAVRSKSDTELDGDDDDSSSLSSSPSSAQQQQGHISIMLDATGGGGDDEASTDLCLLSESASPREKTTPRGSSRSSRRRRSRSSNAAATGDGKKRRRSTARKIRRAGVGDHDDGDGGGGGDGSQEQEMNPLSTSVADNLPANSMWLSLDEILRDQVGANAFRDFLESEWATEVLDVSQEIEDFKRLTAAALDPQNDNKLDSIVKPAFELYDRYLAPSAPDRIFIGEDIVRDVRESLDRFEETADASILADLFEQVHDAVLALMFVDSLPRFLVSDHFGRLAATEAGQNLVTRLPSNIRVCQAIHDESSRGRLRGDGVDDNDNDDIGNQRRQQRHSCIPCLSKQ
jgi:Regulator of G protein signaling domain